MGYLYCMGEDDPEFNREFVVVWTVCGGMTSNKAENGVITTERGFKEEEKGRSATRNDTNGCTTSTSCTCLKDCKMARCLWVQFL